MRILTFLMAFLVLSLSMMPCADIELSGKCDASYAQVKATERHQDEPADNCSPFCQCSCCAGFFVNNAPAIVSAHPVLPTVAVFPHPGSLVLDRSLPVWQPPQLG
ncbi:MAG: hypothetical protein EOP49_00110 [Sphingobacteriales bacterium]|nr:MAG: hypothetical protein EOP49_00110 [Sphingobacteriales bacterium]